MRCTKIPMRRSVGDLIKKSSHDVVCLPDFQRDFVWTPWQMAKLLESIMRGYPIGTLLFLTSAGNRSIKPRSLSPRSHHAEAMRPKWLVVDGQQRLRTLLELLQPPSSLVTYDPIPHGKRTYKIFLKTGTSLGSLGRDVDGLTFLECVSTEKEEKDEFDRQGKRKRIPVEFLLSKRLIREWVRKALRNVSAKTRKNVRRRMERAGKALSSYMCPIEVVKGKLHPLDLANIFNLLNEAGTDLNLFDLCVARLTPHGVKLRNLWGEATKSYKFLNQFHIDGVYVLKVLTLIRQTVVREKDGASWHPTCRKKDIRDLVGTWYDLPKETRLFEDDWSLAARFVNEALSEIHLRFGAPGLKYLPYKPMVITLATALWWVYKYKDYDPWVLGSVMSKLERWYWSSVFSSAYESGTDKVVADHFAALRDWLAPNAGSKRPRTISAPQKRNDIADAIDYEIESSGDARYKAILCLPFMGKAEDILARKMLVGQELQDHHVYPRHYLLNAEELEVDADNIANRMLITGESNGSIKAKPPHQYLSGIDARRLRRHFLFKEIVHDKMKFGKFLIKRRDLLADRVWRLVTKGS